MLADYTLSEKYQLKYTILDEAFQASDRKKRRRMLKDIILSGDWHRKTYKELFIKNALMSDFLSERAAKKFTSLYESIGQAKSHSQGGRTPLPRREISVSDFADQERLEHVTHVLDRWKRYAVYADRVARAPAAQIAQEKLQLLSDELAVMALLRINLRGMKNEANTERRVYVAMDKIESRHNHGTRDKVQGIALIKINDESRSIYLSQMCTHPDNLDIVRRASHATAGVGIALIRHIAQYALENGYNTIELDSLNSSDAWYRQRCGFQQSDDDEGLFLSQQGMRKLLAQQ
jgi:hypothetical protein